MNFQLIKIIKNQIKCHFSKGAVPNNQYVTIYLNYNQELLSVYIPEEITEEILTEYSKQMFPDLPEHLGIIFTKESSELKSNSEQLSKFPVTLRQNDILTITTKQLDYEDSYITIKCLDGKSVFVPVSSSTTIPELGNIMGFESSNMRFIYNGKSLYKGTLGDNGVYPNSVIHLIIRLRGGMYQEFSGRGGSFEPLDNIYFSLDE